LDPISLILKFAPSALVHVDHEVVLLPLAKLIMLATHMPASATLLRLLPPLLLQLLAWLKRPKRVALERVAASGLVGRPTLVGLPHLRICVFLARPLALLLKSALLS